jgi:hypothetical protein
MGQYPFKVTMCDVDHFEAPRRAVFARGFSTDGPQEIDMARAVNMTKTRLARWIKAFRQSRYYDAIE